MRLITKPDPSLPPLAWCLTHTHGSDEAILRCGNSVETTDDAFFEGAWAGEFDAMDFDAVADVFGSGGRVFGDELLIVTPSHTLERVQFIQRGGETIISNSLVFLLSAAGAELDPKHAGYATDFTHVIRYGIDGFRRTIPTRGGENVQLVYLKNIRLNKSGGVSFVDKPAPQSFDSYETYVDALTDVLRQTIRNRALKYIPLASISTGYDSPAVATLIRRCGATRAVTFSTARADGKQKENESDSGRPIAEALGYQLKEFDRDAYRLRGDEFPEAEFLATGMSGEDVNMLAFESELRRSIFFTGFHGDRIWDMHAYPDEKLRRKDMSGASMTEFRLRVDFVHVPAVFIAATLHPQILEIGNSGAMKKWSIGTDYDRPIARRIAEDAGVPRGAFGHAKRATTALLHLHGDAAWTGRTRAAVLQFAQQQNLSPATRLAYTADAAREHGGYFVYRALRKLGLLALAPRLAKKPMGIHSHTRLGPLPMLWAIDQIKPRYARR